MVRRFSRSVRWLIARTWKQAFRVATYGVAGALLMGITLFVVVLERRPDLERWHTVHLDEEFTADSDVANFDEYRALESRLFAQLNEEIYTAGPAGEHPPINRYFRGSLPDPGRWPTNWNRSFELWVDDPKVGVLMLHGLSDAPYSMRSLAETLHSHGATVVVMRVPGHGTAPSGLLHVQWEDMAAAVELAMRHLRDAVRDRPLYLVGYSNGGALAVLYALATLQDASLPQAKGLVLISPEIGISRLAALAAWQERLGRLLGLDKLSWNSISPEYDPFQYKSFALNGAKQAYQLTGEIQKRITKLTAAGDMKRFPAVLAFQSVVDATVSAPALLHGLFDRLPAGNHEAVLFDLNRTAEIEEFLKHDPWDELQRVFTRPDLSFTIALVTNENAESEQVVVRRRVAGGDKVTVTSLGVAWPDQLYSLSHIALPFPPDDPVYGGPGAAKSPGIHLGDLDLRGERGILQISAAEQLRVHWNPFHEFLQQLMLEFMSLPPEPAETDPTGEN